MELICGLVAALQALLSEGMAVIPPPLTAHLPPSSSDVRKDRKENGWVSATVANFRRLRSCLSRERATSGQTWPEDRRFTVPRMKDRAAWRVLCLGKEESYGNAKGYYDEELEEEEEELKDEEDANIDLSSCPHDPTQFQIEAYAVEDRIRPHHPVAHDRIIVWNGRRDRPCTRLGLFHLEK